MPICLKMLRWRMSQALSSSTSRLLISMSPMFAMITMASVLRNDGMISLVSPNMIIFLGPLARNGFMQLLHSPNLGGFLGDSVDDPGRSFSGICGLLFMGILSFLS